MRGCARAFEWQGWMEEGGVASVVLHESTSLYSVIYLLCACVCVREGEADVPDQDWDVDIQWKEQVTDPLLVRLDSTVGCWLNLFPTQLNRADCVLIGSFNLSVIRGGVNRRANVPTSCGPRQRHFKCLGVAPIFFIGPDDVTILNKFQLRDELWSDCFQKRFDANEDSLSRATCCRLTVLTLIFGKFACLKSSAACRSSSFSSSSCKARSRRPSAELQVCLLEPVLAG